MIQTPTVFVLGAGASMPYRFPSGAVLRRQLCALNSGRNSQIGLYLIDSLGFDESEVIDFGKVFLRSNVASIDSFLARRNEFSQIGKLAIAYHLCSLENLDSLQSPLDDDDWYFALWNSLISEVSNIEELITNKVKIVTFNYDRSLEAFLHASIKNTFLASDEIALTALKNIPIIHVYGSLGDFGLRLDDTIRPYTPDTTARSVRTAASGIKIIPEARDDDEVFNIARNWFSETERICFLGFGFDDLNIRRLNLKKVIEKRNTLGRATPNLVIASTHGMTQAEVDIAGNLLGANQLGWITRPLKNLRTLRNIASILR